MIINHVHHHANPGLVVAVDHFLHFQHPRSRVAGVARISPLRNVIVLRVVTPVITRVGAGFINAGKVVHRHELYVGHPEVLQVIQPGRLTGCGVGAGFDHAGKLPLGRHTGIRVLGEVADTSFINHGVGWITKAR